MVPIPIIIEYIFYGQAVSLTQILSSFACLARTDFNFAFALLCYYLWHDTISREKPVDDTGKKLLILNGILFVLDFIWLIVMGSIWGDTPVHDVESWESTSGIRSFALFISWINCLARVAVIGALAFLMKDSLIGQRDSGEGYDMGRIPA